MPHPGIVGEFHFTLENNTHTWPPTPADPRYYIAEAYNDRVEFRSPGGKEKKELDPAISEIIKEITANLVRSCSFVDSGLEPDSAIALRRMVYEKLYEIIVLPNKQKLTPHYVQVGQTKIGWR